MWCKLRTRVRKFAVHLGVDIRVNWARARFTNRPFLVLFRVSMVRISRVSWVRVRVRVRLALVLGLMSSVCMTYSMCVGVLVYKTHAKLHGILCICYLWPCNRARQ